jgi:predicted ABC-type ATPase
MPELYIITGSNGAGKSTVGPTYIPTHILAQCSIFDGDNSFKIRRETYEKRNKANKEVRNIAGEFVERTFDSFVSTH